MKILLAALCLITFNSFAFEEDEEIPQGSNCKIVIDTERFTGIKDSQIIYTKADSAKHCGDKSSPHKYNFYPKEIKTKEVKVYFEGKLLP